MTILTNRHPKDILDRGSRHQYCSWLRLGTNAEKIEFRFPVHLCCLWCPYKGVTGQTPAGLVRHSFCEAKKATKKANSSFGSSIKGDSTTSRMQSEESSTTGESLENLSYPGQHHANEVLNIGGQSADFDETAMGTDHHVHGLKRAVESDDEGEDGVLNDVDLKPKKKTRGRVKIEMKFITNKLRRYTTFSKRKTGIMKKVCFYR